MDTAKISYEQRAKRRGNKSPNRSIVTSANREEFIEKKLSEKK
jgi:hypothetical protein